VFYSGRSGRVLLSGYPMRLNVLMLAGGDIVIWVVRVPGPVLHASLYVHVHRYAGFPVSLGQTTVGSCHVSFSGMF